MRIVQASAKTHDQTDQFQASPSNDPDFSGVKSAPVQKHGPSQLSAPLLDQLPSHPRLFASGKEWHVVAENLKKSGQVDAVHQVVHAKLRQLAKTILGLPLLEHKMEGIRLLTVSREAIRRIFALAALARLESNGEYAERAILELERVANFPDWNHNNFLDTAEMTLAVAVGYDWLYEELSSTQRQLIEEALLEKSILPSFKESPTNWWMTVNTNWNQVCHGGLVAAAIAIGDKYPNVAERTVRRALDCLPFCVDSYAPDGAYTEGLSYWNFGTAYHVILADTLLKATGTTHGVEKFPGFEQSCLYSRHVTGPTGLAFNYGDCRDVQGPLLPLFWLARQAGRKDWAQEEASTLEQTLNRQVEGVSRLLPLLFFWYPAGPQESEAPRHNSRQPERFWLGRGPNPVAAFRTTLGNQKALFAAIKGGSPSTNHAHMDAGAFVLDADGVRWAIDLGMGDYHAYEEQDFALWDQSPNGDRWRAFRFGPESHNIMRHGNGHQSVHGHAPFTHFQNEGASPCAILDLSSIYQHACHDAKRGLMLLNNQAVLIQDEWESVEDSAPVVWQMLTDADVIALSTGWVLKKDNQKLEIMLLDNTDAEFTCEEGDSLLHPVEQLEYPVRRLSIRLAPSLDGRLRVVLIPGSAKHFHLSQYVPLDQWKAKAAATH